MVIPLTRASWADPPNPPQSPSTGLRKAERPRQAHGDGSWWSSRPRAPTIPESSGYRSRFPTDAWRRNAGMRGEWRVLSILPCPLYGEHATPAAMDRTISAWPFFEENFHDPREGIILETAMGVSPFCQAKKPTNPAGSPIPLHPSPPFRQIPRHHRKQVHLQRLLHRPKSDPDHFPVIHPNFRRSVVPARRVFPIHLEKSKSGRVLHRQTQAIPPGFLVFREIDQKIICILFALPQP
jgi:hypothetical protein